MDTKQKKEMEKAKKANPKRFRYKLYFKHDGCTMLLFKNLTYIQSRNRKNALLKMYTEWQGSFIITL